MIKPNSGSHDFSFNDPAPIDKSYQVESRLDRIKHRLLKKSDWAAVGVTRPVKISFKPAEGLARFGKRRKLTHADHSRLVSSSGRTERSNLSLSCERSQQHAPSELENIRDADIRILGTRDKAYSQKTSQSKNHDSSQTMLLGQEESDYGNEKSLHEAISQATRRRTNSSRLLLSPDNGLAGLSISKQSPGYLPPGVNSPMSGPSKLDGLERASIENRQSTGSSVSTGSRSLKLYHPIPQPPRRFTIDDQIAAEFERSTIAPSAINIPDDYQETPQRDAGVASSCAASEIPFESACNLYEIAGTGTQSTSSNQYSSWLPEPTHRIRRFVDGLSRSSTPPAVSLSGESENGHFTRPLRHCVSPIKLFGQGIIVDDQISGIQVPRKPPHDVHEEDQFQYGTPMTSYTAPSPQQATQALRHISPMSPLSNRINTTQLFGDISTRGSFENQNSMVAPFRYRPMIPGRLGHRNPEFANFEQSTILGQMPAASFHTINEKISSPIQSQMKRNLFM